MHGHSLKDGRAAGICACTGGPWLDNWDIGPRIAVIVEGLTALRGELRKAAATSVSIRCRLSKAAVDKEGSVGVSLDAWGFVAITNVFRSHRRGFVVPILDLRGVTLASRNIVDVPEVLGVLGADVDVGTICICFAIPPASTTGIGIPGRTTFADVYQTFHFWIVEIS